jgi:glycosyltransferase involved in cell wall biosynthesis
MRVAVTVGTLRIPPTYFVIAHLERLMGRVTGAVFPLVADVNDHVAVPIRPAVPEAIGPFRRREVLMPAWIPASGARIRAFAPDVVHQHFATWSMPAQLASGRHGPLVVTLHGFDAYLAEHPAAGAMGRWHEANIRGVRRRARRVLAVSSYLAGVALRGGFPSERLHVHYQGIDTDYFAPAAHPPEDPTIAFVGALAARKGLPDVLSASADLHGRGRHHRLLIAGDGPLTPAVRSFVAGHPYATYLGRVDRAGVRDLLRDADVVAMPSQFDAGWREAAGLTALEAQACGIPVAAYRSGGLPEMLAPASLGHAAPEGDVETLAASLWALLTLHRDDPSLAGGLRGWVCAERSLTAGAERLLDIYTEVRDG